MTNQDYDRPSPPGWVPPPWFVSLTRTLSDHHIDDERLPLGVLTSEVRHWSDLGRTSAWVRQGNARSLAADLNATARALGTQLEAAVRVELDALEKAVACLVGGTPPTPALTGVLAAAANGLERRLGDTDVLDAGWADVWKSAKQQNLASLRWRTVCLRDLHAASGRDPRATLTGAMLHTGDSRRVLHTDAALDALREGLTATPATGRCVVWLTYDRALLMSMVADLGRVTFYDARWAMPNATKDQGHEFVHRDELRALVTRPGQGTWSAHTGADERRVIARVDLGERGPRGAIEEAERVVQTLTQIAAVKSLGVV